jgi:succinate dehydrogenase / fumarate reductase cytochrome b subunit
MSSEHSFTQRPTSPHLTIYRKQITTVLSILHRMTGLALFAGTALITFWLWSAAYAPSFYSTLHNALTSILGQACMMGWTIAFYFHLGNGIRHLFWDMGKGFTIPQATKSGWSVIIFTIAMTAFTWGVVYSTTVQDSIGQ